MRPLPSPCALRVVGVSFVDGYPANLLALRESAERRWLFSGGTFASGGGPEPEPIPAVLIRNPDNAHDANAVEVHVPEVGMIGHVPARLAERLAPELDGGVRWQAGVESVNVHPDHLDRPGIGVTLTRVEDDGEGTSAVTG